MERLTGKNQYGYYVNCDKYSLQEAVDRLAEYEEAEEQGLLIKLPKNFKTVVEKKKAESNAIINELIRALRPYATYDRLFKAVDAVRVFVARQNYFIDTLLNYETSLKGDSEDVR